MKIFLNLFILLAIMLPVSANAAPAQDLGTSLSFRDIEGKEWILLELRDAGKTILMDRQKLEAENMGGFFTIRFEDGRLGGVGAPNRYFGPYTAGAGRDLDIGILASTLMMALREPEFLKESEFFDFLSRVSRWDLREGKLELYSPDGDGNETVLVFISG